jgi:hypothetical protein
MATKTVYEGINFQNRDQWVRFFFAYGFTQKEISHMFDLHVCTISRIIAREPSHGKCYDSWVKELKAEYVGHKEDLERAQAALSSLYHVMEHTFLPEDFEGVYGPGEGVA